MSDDEQNGADMSEVSTVSKHVDSIRKLSELGVPTVISLAVTGLVLWYGIKVFPNYLDRQAKSSEKMADTAEANTAVNTEIKQSLVEIQAAAEETLEVERETKVFMEGVKRDHEECLKDHDIQDKALEAQTKALQEILIEVKRE